MRTTLEITKDFFEHEYKQIKNLTINPPRYPYSLEEVKDHTIDRMLGVALFVQNFDDVTYEDIEILYNEYKEKVEKISS